MRKNKIEIIIFPFKEISYFKFNFQKKYETFSLDIKLSACF